MVIKMKIFPFLAGYIPSRLLFPRIGSYSQPTSHVQQSIHPSAADRPLGPWCTGLLVFAFGSLMVLGQSSPPVRTVCDPSENVIGSATDACSVILGGKTSSGGVRVSLQSSAAAAKVPATAPVPDGGTYVAFNAAFASAPKAETTTLAVAEGSSSQTSPVELATQASTQTYALSVSWSAVSFGNVALNSTVTHSTTLKSTGTGTVTVTSAKVAGTGFSLKGASFPITLKPGVAVPLWLQFDPTQAGAATGTLTLSSTAFTGGTKVVSLKGTGLASKYQVDLSWVAPDSTEKIAGYRVYRATSGSSTYVLLDPNLDAETSYTDSTVAAGVTYDYYVESVTESGTASAPSSVIPVAVP